MDGDWETPDLPALLTLAAINDEALLESYYGARWAAALRRLWHTRRANTRAGSRRNIAYHYDLGNAFYERWLDGSMTYSSAVFARDDETLAEAQANKYRRIAEKLEIASGASVLEVGCGWGGFARLIAREFGARVTAITVSRQQHDYARSRARKTKVSPIVSKCASSITGTSRDASIESPRSRCSRRSASVIGRSFSPSCATASTMAGAQRCKS